MSPPPSTFADLYPFRSNFLDLDGVRMHFLDEGPRDAPPILLLHGNPTWSFYYRELIRDLRTDYRVVVPDHVGCGLSDKPPHYPYRLDQHIQNVERLVHSLDLDAVTLGVHDWGGAIGFGLAARHPDRFTRFVVFNTAAFFGPVPWRIQVCRWPLLGALVVRGLNGFAGPATVMACRRPLPRDVRRAYLAPYDSYGNRIAVWAFVQDIPTRPSHPTWEAIARIDGSLGQFRDRPMLICWGMRDFCFNPTFLQGWTTRFPEAQVHRFDDAGHYVVEDARERIIPTLRAFLTQAARP